MKMFMFIALIQILQRLTGFLNINDELAKCDKSSEVASSSISSVSMKSACILVFLQFVFIEGPGTASLFFSLFILFFFVNFFTFLAFANSSASSVDIDLPGTSVSLLFLPVLICFDCLFRCKNSKRRYQTDEYFLLQL